MENTSVQPDISVQSQNLPQNSQQVYDIGDISESGEYGENVMGDAVRSVEQTKKSQQQQQIQKIKLRDKEYDPSELEKIVNEVPNYKKGMHQAFERASKAEKMLQQVEHILTNSKDPIDLLNQLKIPQNVIDQAIERYAEQRIREHQMTPEQRQWEADKREKAQLQQQLEQHKQQQQQQYMQMLEQHHMNEYDQQFKAQIASKNLPYTKMDLYEMANLIAIGNAKGMDMDFATAAEQMLENRKSGLKMYLNELTKKDPEGNLLEEWLRDTNVFKTIQKRLISKIKTPGQPVRRIQASQQTPAPKEKMTPQEWRQLIKSR